MAFRLRLLRSVQWTARAARFPLELPVSYCDADGGDWQGGMTVEVSASGAVLRAAHFPTARPPALILIIGLPFTDGCLVGKGQLARTVAAWPESGAVDVALAIEDFQIVPRRSVAVATDCLLRQTHAVDLR